jgi:hypothetical protein
MNFKLIETKIHSIRGQKILLDFDLAELYEVETRALKQSVRRNPDRFPEDFMFQLTKQEWEEVITICDNLPKMVKYSPALPFAFTEQGVAMLSSVLSSKKALSVNIAIMRAFVFMRQYALTHADLTEKLREIEKTCNIQFKDIYEAINYLMRREQLETNQKERKRIGYK